MKKLLTLALLLIPLAAPSQWVRGHGPTRAAKPPDPGKLLQARGNMVQPVSTNAAAERLNGRIEQWSAQGTVEVVTQRTRRVWVTTGEIRTRGRASAAVSAGASFLPGGGSYGRPLDHVQRIGHWEERNHDVTVRVAGVAAGTVVAGRDVEWRVVWTDKGKTRGRLVGPAGGRRSQNP